MPEMTTYERALQIYQVLISLAHNRQTLTYSLLGDLVGLPRQSLGAHLDHLFRYCQHNNLPQITVLIVRKTEGNPSSGFSAEMLNLDQERERVFEYPWFRQKPLTVEDLKALA
ncbi:hypothetical protein [Herpetosiphon giganteus]|uniref:hypothetical protein n=1 Tax=Herpetosiphon giganteus TaxID=2029754 RepID=UPI001959EAB5|nr:hypothetical protein [Herpetosiphon giganteus]MBM7842122.1 hypothetical protein [Herpetosiphon giganteus]